MATKEEIPTLAGEAVKHQSGFEALSTENAQAAILNMPAFIACACEAWTNRTMVGQVQKIERYLMLIPEEETLLLEPVNDTRFIGLCSEVFTGWIDPNFNNWGLNNGRNLATTETAIQVHEMIKDGTFEKIYESLGNLDELCFTQSQIVQLCQKHHIWFKTRGYATLFFLFKVGAKYFVARTLFGSCGPKDVDVSHLSRDHVWRARNHHRFVLPQQTLGN